MWILGSLAAGAVENRNIVLNKGGIDALVRNMATYNNQIALLRIGQCDCT
jgi:hypothetical protein